MTPSLRARGEGCIAPGCTARAVHLHHAVTRQHIRKEHGDPRDARVLVPVCWTHHERHHSRAEPLPLRVLPDAVFEFAAELMGPLAAHVYLERAYAGRDPRLDALLSEAA